MSDDKKKEIKELKQELADQKWGMFKTNEAIKELYKELEDKNKRLQELDILKTDFISTVSHELRTPLSIAKEGIKLVFDGVLGEINEKQKSMLDIACDNIERLTRIINDLLDISKIESGNVELTKTNIKLKELVSEITAAFAASIKKENIYLKINIMDNAGEVYADKDKITQVLINLVSNAINFTEEGGVKINVRERENEILISVSDTGIGIEKKDYPKIFDKFQQVGREDGPGYKGTGLGLAITKEIVEMHDGEMWVESELGKGTTIYFTLPKNDLAGCLWAIDQKLSYVGDDTHKQKPSLMLIDIINMEEIKDMFGDGAVDKVLSQLSKICFRHLRRPGDFVNVCFPRRIIGLLPKTNSKGARSVAKKIYKSVRDERFSYRGREMKIKLSVGVAENPYDGRSAEELLRSAEKNSTKTY